MRSRWWRLVLLAIALVLGGGAAASAGEHRLGLGLHYWRTLDQIGDDGVDALERFEDSGVSQIASYQYLPGQFFKFEIDVEFFGDGFGGSTSSAFSPQAYLLVGHGIYAGVGVGVTVGNGFDGEMSKPFYAVRGGWEIGLFPRVTLVLEGNYRVDAWQELESEGVDTDTVTLGVAVRATL